MSPAKISRVVGGRPATLAIIGLSLFFFFFYDGRLGSGLREDMLEWEETSRR